MLLVQLLQGLTLYGGVGEHYVRSTRISKILLIIYKLYGQIGAAISFAREPVWCLNDTAT